MATGAVLGTAELLANILHELDVKTLLLSRRVSRQWSIVIDSSPELQEKLCYRPRLLKQTTRFLWAPKTCHLELLADADLPNDSMSPTLNASSGAIRRSRRARRLRATPGSTLLLSSMSLNPLLNAEVLCLGIERDLGKAYQGEHLERISINHFLNSPHGTWKSMFLCQPPATKVVALNLCQQPVDSLATDRIYLTMEDPTGVRMSQVVKKIVDSVKDFDDRPKGRLDYRLEDWRLLFPGRIDLTRQADRMAMPPPPTPRPARALSNRMPATSQPAR